VSGTLYVVATPIGNLEDLSPRAAETLRNAAVVACEDTRQTGKLMAAAASGRPLISLHEHNEEQRTGELVERMVAGEDVALVSDAGTPLVSDPGYRLVEAAIAAGIRICPIPGPSAVIAALSMAGLPTDRFAFLGFLPHKSAARRKLLEQWATVEATLVCFESPHRILEALADLEALWPERKLAACREITKLHEEVLRGTAGSIRKQLGERPAIKGEFTLVIDRAAADRLLEEEDWAERLAELEQLGMKRMDAIKEVARLAGVPKRVVYDRLMQENKPAT
jgi:16S rRNA (cytidine1402-2'-O)-methyltransferase